MSRKQTGLSFEPSDAPGIVVEYTLHPAQEGMPPTRDGEGSEYIPARVDVETVTCGNLTSEVRTLLSHMHCFLKIRAEMDSDAASLYYRVGKVLATKPTNLFPWLQLHGADQDVVIERLEEGILTGHRE